MAEHDESVERICREWPRLYLDTAELVDIADGRADPRRVSALVTAMRARGVLLVVSVEHIQDAIPRADADAVDRFSCALEQFPLIALVDAGPGAIEPWEDEDGDIGIVLASNIRDVITAPEATPWLERMSQLQDDFHQGAVRATTVARPVANGKEVPKSAREVFDGSVVTLVRGWKGYDPEPIVRLWEETLDVDLGENHRAIVLQSLQRVAAMMISLHPIMISEGVDPANALVQSVAAASPHRRPGVYLAARLSENRQRNAARKPLRSDLLDCLHVTHFPYVDIATCDKQTFDVMSKYLDKAIGPRRPKLVKNGHLDNLIEAVEKLPLSCLT